MLDCAAGQEIIDPFDPTYWDEPIPWRVIYLSDRDPSLFCLVDAIDYEWASKQLWFATNSRYKKRYAAHTRGRYSSRSITWLHKEILTLMGPMPTSDHFIGDHLNGNSLDNRRRNLRWATEAENQANRNGKSWRQLRFHF